MNHPTVSVDPRSGLERERDDLGLEWGEYLLYVLEVDREEVNEDGLNEIAGLMESAL